MLKRTAVFVAALLLAARLFGQSITMQAPARDSVEWVSSHYPDQIVQRTGQVEKKSDRYTTRVLRNWKKQEKRIRNKLAGSDPAKARQLLGNADEQFAALDRRLQHGGCADQYIPSLDTLATSLRFLQVNRSGHLIGTFSPSVHVVEGEFTGALIY